MNKYDLDTPAVLIDLDVMEQNITDMAAFMKLHHVNLRPHIKTHKIPEIAQMQLKAGAVGLTCAKLGEAEVMAPVSNDLFIANMIVGQQKIERLLNLAKRILISVGVDCSEVAEAISSAAKKQGLIIPLLIKIDSGLKRTGVVSPQAALELCQRLNKWPGIELTGIYTHEGHGVLTFDSQKDHLCVGDKIEIIPNHVCPVVNLVDSVVGIRGDKIETTWKIAARGMIQ